jgi:Na+/H+ antiporter NhaD/arsenite permease-like protein
VLIQIVAAVASAFVDNIPFTTTMLPVIKRLAAGAYARPLFSST